MRTTLIVAASALALFVAPALAQQSPAPATVPGGPAAGGATGTGAGAVPAPPPKLPAPNPLAQEDTSRLKGKEVYGSEDKKLGDVETALMKPDSKTIDRLVLRYGGMLGLGGHAVALPIDAFSWDGERGAFRIARTEGELRSMPEWKPPAAASAGSGAPAVPSSGSSSE